MISGALCGDHARFDERAEVREAFLDSVGMGGFFRRRDAETRRI